jgi:hypothetical protein
MEVLCITAKCQVQAAGQYKEFYVKMFHKAEDVCDRC